MKRSRPADRPKRRLWLLLLVLLLCLFPTTTLGQTVTPQQCLIFLAASDTSRDDLLDRETEFPRFATVIMPGSSYTTFAATPASFQTIYDKYAAATGGTLSVAGARPGSNPTPAQSQTLTQMCGEFLAALPASTPAPLPPPPAPAVTPAPGPVVSSSPAATTVNVPFTTCRVSMAVADSNRDDSLSQQEYVTFLNRLTANRRGFTAFAGLPQGLQSTFTTLAGGGTQLPIAGASPASFATATAEQKAALEQICTSTQAALNDGANAGTGPPTTPIATSAPQSTTPLFTPTQCRVSLAIADTNRDNQITAQEYVSFVNRLTRNQYAGTPFEGLPPELQTNFNTLAAAGTEDPTTIAIAGAQPAQYAASTADQKAFLDRICADTQAITAAATTAPATLAPVATIAPATLAPVATSTTPPGVTLIPFIQCRARMHAVDIDRDYLMNQQEYAHFVDRLVPTVSYPTYESLPANLQTTFAQLATSNGQIDIYGALPSQPVDATQLAALEKICTDTQIAIGGQTTTTTTPSTALPIGSSLPPTYAPVDAINCGADLDAADASPKDGRLDQSEYANFAWRLTNNERFIAYTYDELPQLLKDNFMTLSADGVSLVLTGTATGAPGTVVTDEQLRIVAAICTATIGAINQYIVLSATPAPSVPAMVTTPLATCKLYLERYDVDQNLQLIADPEYVQFANEMAKTQPGGPWTAAPIFGALPSLVQGAFSALAQPLTYIPIDGTTAAVPATAAQEQNLIRICGAVDKAIYDSMYGGTEPPVDPETIPPTQRPTVNLETCKVYIGTADQDKNEYLESNEYKDFVNSMSVSLQIPAAGATYDAFHPALKQNFETLAAVDISSPHGRQHVVTAIDVYGTQIASALLSAEEQKQFINRVCVDTAYAIQDAVAPPSPAPTVGPTVWAPTVAPLPTLAPTPFNGLVKIDNSFYVFNTVGITADDLNQKGDEGDYLNNNRRQFQAVYQTFIPQLVNLVAAGAPVATGAPVAFRFLRSRRFLVGYQGDTAFVREFEDITCPPQILTTNPLAVCQKVFADYTVNAVTEGSQQLVYDYFVGLTQNSMIPPANPNLRDEARRYNSPLEVYGATPEVEVWEPPPTAAPTINPYNPFELDEQDANTVLAVVMVGFLALIALGIYFAWNDKDRIKRKWRAFKARQREMDDEELEEDGELAPGEDGNIQQGENDEEDYDDGEVYDDEYEDEYDVEDPKGGKKNKRAKKLLGTLGKNVGKIGKRVGLGDNEDDEDLGFGFQDENLLDFEDYVFDTPAELLTEQNRAANKMGEEAGGKGGGREGTKRGGALSTSITSGGHPSAMTDSVASSTSSMEGSDMSGDDDFDEYGFDDEYSDDSEEEEEDSFGLSMSDSGDGEDTISSKGDEIGKDDGSLSSSDEQGGDGAALVGENIEGMLEAARANGENGEDGDEGDDNDDEDGSESGSSYYSDSTTSSHEARMAEYRNEVKELVAKVIPEELDNLSTMMDQFEGREAELINTLQNMEERTSTQRARAAVHKTKVKVNPNQVGGYSIASEGSAVIAAASTLGPEPQRRQPRVQQYDDYDDYDDEYTDEYSDEYYDDEYYDDEGTYYSDEEGSYYDEEGSYYDEEGTYYSDEEGSYYDEEGYDDEYGDEGSYYSGEEEGSYYSGEEEGSYYSGEEGEEGSYVSGEGSYYDEEGEGSYYSGEEEGSYYSGEEGEEGSYVSGEGSYYDEEEGEGSYYSGEEEGSYYSGEEGSYYSGEEEGSYVSGEDDYYDD